MRQLCHVLRVAPAAYYRWQRRQQVPTVEPARQVDIRRAFSQRYGTRRLRVEVQADGHAVGRWRICRVLKVHGLRAAAPLACAAHRPRPGSSCIPTNAVSPRPPVSRNY
ncbi:MAG TPA: IS3 family transposase [Hymenobacter sp.]